MRAVRNYELKGRGVECRGADFLVKRDTTSTTAAIVVSRRCFIARKLLSWGTLITGCLDFLFYECKVN